MKKNHTKYKIVAVVSIVFIIIVVIGLGYAGLIQIPGVSPSVQSYDQGVEIYPSSTIQQYLNSVQDVPSLMELQNSGLTAHFYGTNQSENVVDAFYSLQLTGWSLDYQASGNGWSSNIWRNIAYGFGIFIIENPMVKQQTGYNTIYMTAAGPATAWLNVIQKYSH